MMDEATDKAATFWLIFFSSLTMALATNFSTWCGRWKVTVAHCRSKGATERGITDWRTVRKRWFRKEGLKDIYHYQQIKFC